MDQQLHRDTLLSMRSRKGAPTQQATPSTHAEVGGLTARNEPAVQPPKLQLNTTPNTKSKPQVLVIEDVHEATSVLMDNGHPVTRVTHAEITFLGGDVILGR